MLQNILLLAMLLSVISLPTEGNIHKHAAEPQLMPMIPEHEERNSRSYQLIYPNQIPQYPKAPSSQVFRSGGFINNLYYPPIQGGDTGLTETRRSDISSIYRFLYPDQNQPVYSSSLPVQNLNPESNSKVQASNIESQIPKDESMTGQINPTNLLLSSDQIQQVSPVQIESIDQSETQLNVEAGSLDSKEESKDQQIKPTNRLLNPDQNQHVDLDELSVQTDKVESETNLQESVKDGATPKDELTTHQIKNYDIKKQIDEPQPSDELKPKISSASLVNNRSDSEPSTLPENNSLSKVESGVSDQMSTTVNPPSPNTADTILSVPTKKPFRKHHKKHHKDQDLIDEIFDAFFSSEEI